MGGPRHSLVPKRVTINRFVPCHYVMSAYQNILAAIDFSSAAEMVGQRAADLANRNQAKLTFLHVVEYLPPIDFAFEPLSGPDWMIAEEELIEHAQNSLRQFAEKTGIAEAAQIALVGLPKDAIVRIAREHATDLIVVGSHGRHGISRLLGSTANGVLHTAPCDVLAVRIKGKM